MQNNLADSQHFGGVSMAVAKVSPPIAVKRFDAFWCAVARLANHGYSAIYGYSDNYCIAKT